MKSFFLRESRKGNEIFPTVELNAKTGICRISGNSYMQDARTFFKPVIQWFKEYTSEKKGDLILIYNLQNLNTGTSRVLYEILDVLKEYKKYGANIKIIWNHIESPEMLSDDIVDMTSEFGIDVEVTSENY